MGQVLRVEGRRHVKDIPIPGHAGLDLKQDTLTHIGASDLLDMEIDERILFPKRSRRGLNRWRL